MGRPSVREMWIMSGSDGQTCPFSICEMKLLVHLSPANSDWLMPSSSRRCRIRVPKRLSRLPLTFRGPSGCYLTAEDHLKPTNDGVNGYGAVPPHLGPHKNHLTEFLKLADSAPLLLQRLRNPL